MLTCCLCLEQLDRNDTIIEEFEEVKLVAHKSCLAEFKLLIKEMSDTSHDAEGQ